MEDNIRLLLSGGDIRQDDLSLIDIIESDKEEYSYYTEIAFVAYDNGMCIDIDWMGDPKNVPYFRIQLRHGVCADDMPLLPHDDLSKLKSECPAILTQELEHGTLAREKADSCAALIIKLQNVIALMNRLPTLPQQVLDQTRVPGFSDFPVDDPIILDLTKAYAQQPFPLERMEFASFARAPGVDAHINVVWSASDRGFVISLEITDTTTKVVCRSPADIRATAKALAESVIPLGHP